METVVPSPRVDERAMGAGTAVRFVLLLILLLVSSGSMMRVVTGRFDGGIGYGCLLAAGGDPTQGTNRAVYTRIIAYYDAYQACGDRYEPAAPWWLTLLWPVLLVTATVVLFRRLPLWKARRGRVVPLEAIDQHGEIRRRLEDLAAAAGLARVPRIVVDPAAASTDAVVFGSNRRPIVRLNGGLLTRGTTDPEGFRAVVMHEFAHIRNGDVTITYATIAMWRVFIALALLPYVAWYLTAIPASILSPFWFGEAAFVTRSLLLPVFMVLLVYLARSDVLRSREIYADLTAIRWGADLRDLAFTASARDRGRLQRALGSFADLWRTHPRWPLRRDAMTDPAALFGVQALPMFLTGAAAPLIGTQAAEYLPLIANTWAVRPTTLVAAGLTTGVAGIALWRAVAHAVLTGRRVPSGARAGLWLGAGAVAGELILNRLAVQRWLPDHPAVLALLLFAGAVFGWWTAQCAHLWVRAWPGRTIRPAMLLGLGAAWLVLSAWFVWWESQGVLLASAGSVDLTGMGQVVRELYAASPDDHPGMQAAIAVVWPLLSGLDGLLVLPAVMALWVVPLLAWTLRPAGTPPRWALGVLNGAGGPGTPRQALPPLRRVLLVALLGVLTCWAAVAVVMGYMHTWQPSPGYRGGFYALVYQAWVLVALVAGAAVAALAASVLVSRYRLLVALIAAEIVALGGLAGRFVLAGVDGCLPPLNTMATSCHWLPSPAWALVQMILGDVLVLAAIAAVIAAATVSVAQTVRRSKVRSADPEPVPGHVRGGLAVRRFCTAVLCVVAMTVTVAVTLAEAGQQSWSGPDVGSKVRQVMPVDQVAVSTEIRHLQVNAWWGHGGWDLQERYNTVFARLAANLGDAARNGHGDIDSSLFRPLCADIGQIARDANRYFPNPDPDAQVLWQTFITQADKGGRDCQQSLEQENADLFIASMKDLIRTKATLGSVVARANEVRRAAGS